MLSLDAASHDPIVIAFAELGAERLAAMPSVGDRLRILEQLGRQASQSGLAPDIAAVLRGFAVNDDHAETRNLASEILGALATWDHWPAAPVAQELSRIEGTHDTDAVVGLARDLVQKVPTCFRGWLRLADALSEQGRAREARAACDKALWLRPRDSRTRLLSCAIDMALERPDAARRTIDELLRDFPGDPEARFHSGWVHQDAGETLAALENYRIAAKATDHQPHGEAVRDMAELADDAEALLEADVALARIAPDSAIAQLHAAHSLEVAGRSEQARRHWARARELGAEIDPSSFAQNAEE